MTIRTHGRNRAVTALGLIAAVAAGFWLGRGPQSAVAAPPAAKPPVANAPGSPPSDYSQRVVAYIYGSIPITREDLGEYLIARMKAGTVETLVNRKIIEVACEKRNITATDAEIEAVLMHDLDAIKVKKAEFVKTILERKGMSLFEYKDEVLKPTVLMTKLVKNEIKDPSDDELHKAFDATYGEKRNCRIIIWPNGEPARNPLREYEDIRASEEGFDRKARTQANSALAATGGRIKPISHNSGVHEAVEKAAFTLRPGELSSTIETKEGVVVVKMDEVIPPDTTVKFEDKREDLRKEVYDRMVAAEIPKMFLRLRDEAKPAFILKKGNDPMTVEREVEQELRQTGVLGPATPRP